jgi:hypothetical protein
MNIEPQYYKEIVHILTDIFPGTLIYYIRDNIKESTQDGKEPEVDIAIDVGRKVGEKDLAEAQKALAETQIPYTIYLYDLNGVSEHERKRIINKAQALKL